jgi:phosphate transport system substrate-binding protein
MKNKFLLLAASMVTAVQVLGGSITIKGSDTMVVLAQKWAEAYMQKTPGAKVQVTGGGSGIGFAALQNGQTDLATASRPIKAKETENCIKSFGKRPTEYKVALDGITIYVNPVNPVKQLTVVELEGIYTGKITNWKDVGGPDLAITVYSRENSSGTYEFFKEHVLKGKDFAANAQTQQGTAGVVQAVMKDKGGIGYGGVGYAAGVNRLKIAKSKDDTYYEPSEEAVLAETYPLWRYLYIYVNPAVNTGEVSSLLKWIRSDEGQKLVSAASYYPLPATLRTK